MSSLATRLVTWEEFLELPESTDKAEHYELHDGEVVLVPPPSCRHVALQAQIVKLLRPVEDLGFYISIKFPYRPAVDYQFWKADVAIVPAAVLDAMARTPEVWQVYAPPLVIEVLSPSNTMQEMNRKRVVAMSAGTTEFWVVDADARAVHVTTKGAVKTFRQGETIALEAVPGVAVSVDAIFQHLE